MLIVARSPFLRRSAIFLHTPNGAIKGASPKPALPSVAAFGRGDQRLHQRPFLISQVTGITQPRPLIDPPVLLRPHAVLQFIWRAMESQPIHQNQEPSGRDLTSTSKRMGLLSSGAADPHVAVKVRPSARRGAPSIVAPAPVQIILNRCR